MRAQKLQNRSPTGQNQQIKPWTKRLKLKLMLIRSLARQKLSQIKLSNTQRYRKNKLFKMYSQNHSKTTLILQTIIEKSGDVYDQSIKLVDEGVKTVTKDVAELSEAIVEDSKATYSAFSEVTYTTIEQVINVFT